MSWFRKKLNEEVSGLIDRLDEQKKSLDRNWEWRDKKLKELRELEETDLEIIRKVRALHRMIKDNPRIYERIIFLAEDLKKELEALIKTAGRPEQKISLAKDIAEELEKLLKKETEEQSLIKGMTRKQAEKLGIQVESFYTVTGPNSRKRIMHGEGTWPMQEFRANLGIGVYTFDDLEAAETYRKMRKEQLSEQGHRPDLKIIMITFSKFTLEQMKQQGKSKDLRLIPDEKREEWLDRHSSYGDQNVTEKREIKKPHLHKFLRVISRRAHGIEHYFRPECLKQAAVEIVS